MDELVFFKCKLFYSVFLMRKTTMIEFWQLHFIMLMFKTGILSLANELHPDGSVRPVRTEISETCF